MRTQCFINPNIFWRTQNLASGRTHIFSIDPTHSFINETPEPEGRAPLESITTSRPLELVCIDLWSAEASSNKSLDVLVVTDHFTKLA